LINSPAVKGATVSSVLGPFYRENPRHLDAGESIAPTQPGEVIAIEGRVLDTDGKPIAGATVDVWQASIEGAYDSQGPQPEEHDLRGRFTTDGAGRYTLLTVPPLGYSVPADGPVGDMLRAAHRHPMRPSHIHFMISAPGHRELVTALYLRGDDKLGHTGSDTVFGVSESLAVELEDPADGGPRRIPFDFVLLPAGAEGSVRVGADPATLVPAG
jgi:protocatechuate 3,4-dioxygenase beta subunit